MLLRIIKIVIFSIGIIALLQYANEELSDWESIKAESIQYKSLNGEKWSESLPVSPGIGMLRTTFAIGEKDPFPHKQKEVVIAFLGAYDLYWEGTFIASNGKVSGLKSGEIPGLLDQKFIIPDTLLHQGSYELILEFSDHRNTDRANITEITIEPYHYFYKWTIFQAMLIYALAGIFLVVTIYYFFLYFNTFQKVSYLLFAMLCGLSFVLIVYAYSRSYYPFTYDQYQTRQVIIWSLSSLIGLTLPFFYLHYFNHPYKKVFNIAIPAVFLLSAIISWPPGPAFTVLAILLPLYFVIWALVKSRRGGIEAMIGLIVFLSSLMYFNINVYVGFGLLIIIMLFSLSINLGIERKEHERSILRSSLLESQLLKKNIQPHFLMNTLTNIISLIESDPKMSIKLIEALSDEFYALIEISDKRLIPIEKEVELCKAHLEIMSIRHDLSYSLETSLNGSCQVPPAILHTLVENGITHNDPIDGKVQFRLSAKKDLDSGYKIILDTHGISKRQENMMKDGTGLKYIKSRLEESFPGKWEIENVRSNNRWSTAITIAR